MTPGIASLYADAADDDEQNEGEDLDLQPPPPNYVTS